MLSSWPASWRVAKVRPTARGDRTSSATSSSRWKVEINDDHVEERFLAVCVGGGQAHRPAAHSRPSASRHSPSRDRSERPKASTARRGPGWAAGYAPRPVGYRSCREGGRCSGEPPRGVGCRAHLRLPRRRDQRHDVLPALQRRPDTRFRAGVAHEETAGFAGPRPTSSPPAAARWAAAIVTSGPGRGTPAERPVRRQARPPAGGRASSAQTALTAQGGGFLPGDRPPPRCTRTSPGFLAQSSTTPARCGTWSTGPCRTALAHRHPWPCLVLPNDVQDEKAGPRPAAPPRAPYYRHPNARPSSRPLPVPAEADLGRRRRRAAPAGRRSRCSSGRAPSRRGGRGRRDRGAVGCGGGRPRCWLAPGRLPTSGNRGCTGAIGLLGLTRPSWHPTGRSATGC